MNKPQESQMNVRGDSIIAFGKRYNSLQHLAESYDINSHVLYERIYAGATPEEAVEMGESKFTITVYGRTFKSAVSLSEHFSIDYNVLIKRISKGQDPEVAVKDLLNNEPILFMENKYSNLIDLCNEYGLQITTVTRRLERGWSLGDAVSKPVETRLTGRTYCYKGISYNTKRELTDAYGLSIDIVKDLSRTLQVDYIQSLDILANFLNTYKGNRPKKVSKIPFIIYGDIWFDTLKSFCDYIGIEFRKFNAYKRDYKTGSHFETFIMMQKHSQTRWIDNNTGEVTSQATLVKRYSSDIATLNSKGIARKAEVKAYPTLNFDSDRYFVTPNIDFKEYLAIYSNQTRAIANDTFESK